MANIVLGTTTVITENNGAITLNTDNPMFSAYKSSAQTGIADWSADPVKITFDAEDVDTHSAYNSSTFTVPSGYNGNYFISSKVAMWALNDSDLRDISLFIVKNGSRYDSIHIRYSTNDIAIAHPQITAIMPLVADDTIEIHVAMNTLDGSNSTAMASIRDYTTSFFTADRMTTFIGYRIQ